MCVAKGIWLVFRGRVGLVHAGIPTRLPWVSFPCSHLLLQAVLKDQAQVRQMELEIRPVFLVPDTNGFIDHLGSLIKLLDCRQFILVVPLIGEWAVGMGLQLPHLAFWKTLLCQYKDFPSGSDPLSAAVSSQMSPRVSLLFHLANKVTEVTSPQKLH